MDGPMTASAIADLDAFTDSYMGGHGRDHGRVS